MAFKLTLAQGGPLEFHSGLPSHYLGPVLPGALAFSASTENANFIFQEFTGNEYSIRFIIGRFLEKVYAHNWIQTTGLYSYFMLKNGARKEIISIGKIHLREDQYAFFFSGSTDCSAKFEEDKEFRAMEFFYSPKLLVELVPFFPELKEIISESGRSFLTGNASWCLPSMKEITNQILNCPFDEGTRQFYFDLKVREMLFQILENTYRQKTTDIPFRSWEIKKIYEARDILNGSLSKKPPLIKCLARQVALNEFKLKAGFRKFFDAGIFEWIMTRKMYHARDLIITTNIPIKEIARRVGYPRTTNFITAFRRHFGITPGELRRK